MDEIVHTISFGIGRINREAADDPVLEGVRKADFAPQRKLLKLAESQLGTVGAGNHYVDLFGDEQDRLWIGVHFGSRGFGHRTATGFLAMAEGQSFTDRPRTNSMDAPPVLLEVRSEMGQAYISAMRAGRRVRAGRASLVVQRTLRLLSTQADLTVHNHHNFAWEEKHFGQTFWVVRKGATPAFPGQQGFVGATMGGTSVILEGIDSPASAQALYSTVHGAGRVMSRRQAAGRRRYNRKRKQWVQTSPGVVDWPAVRASIRRQGIELRGGGADEAPEAYKNLDHVLAEHAGHRSRDSPPAANWRRDGGRGHVRPVQGLAGVQGTCQSGRPLAADQARGPEGLGSRVASVVTAGKLDRDIAGPDGFEQGRGHGSGAACAQACGRARTRTWPSGLPAS